MEQIILYKPETQDDCILLKNCKKCFYYQGEIEICPQILNRFNFHKSKCGI